MIKFETFKKFVEAHKTLIEGEDLIRQGLAKIGTDSVLYFDNDVEYRKSQMLEEMMGEAASEVMNLWMWDYEFGTKCPPPDDNYETLHSDIEEFFYKDLLSLIE